MKNVKSKREKEKCEINIKFYEKKKRINKTQSGERKNKMIIRREI